MIILLQVWQVAGNVVSGTLQIVHQKYLDINVQLFSNALQMRTPSRISYIKAIVFQGINWKDFFFFWLKILQITIAFFPLFLSLSLTHTNTHAHTFIKMLKEQSFIPHTLTLYLTFGSDSDSVHWTT